MNWLQENLHLSPELQARLFGSLAILLLLWLVRWLTGRIIHGRTDNVTIRYRAQKILDYVIAILAVLFVGRLWLEGIETLTTYLGLATAGLTIALQEPIVNLAGWLFIVGRKPFIIGNRIQIGNYAGDVVDISIFQFALLEIGNWADLDQSTGRIIYIPNGIIFREGLHNYDVGFAYIWHEIPVHIDLSSNWQKAKTILVEILQHHAAPLNQDAQEQIRAAARRFMIFYSRLTPIIYTRVSEQGITLTLRYICKPRDRRTSEHAIWEEILIAFAQHPDIEFSHAAIDIRLSMESQTKKVSKPAPPIPKP